MANEQRQITGVVTVDTPTQQVMQVQASDSAPVITINTAQSIKRLAEQYTKSNVIGEVVSISLQQLVPFGNLLRFRKVRFSGASADIDTIQLVVKGYDINSNLTVDETYQLGQLAKFIDLAGNVREANIDLTVLKSSAGGGAPLNVFATIITPAALTAALNTTLSFDVVGYQY